MRRSLLSVATAAALAGCGTADDREEARAVVERFYAAVREDRGDIACDGLSAAARSQLESQSGQACEDVVSRLEYDGTTVVGVRVYITNAKVDLRGGESAFLSLEPAGWRLSAVACKPEQGPPERTPLDCEVEA